MRAKVLEIALPDKPVNTVNGGKLRIFSALT
jgi:hypothetical protein